MGASCAGLPGRVREALPLLRPLLGGQRVLRPALESAGDVTRRRPRGGVVRRKPPGRVEGGEGEGVKGGLAWYSEGETEGCLKLRLRCGLKVV